MRSKNIITAGSIALFFLRSVLFSAGAWAADSVGEPGRDAKKPNPLKSVYFGEEHLHTVNSPDTFAFGTRNTPDDAYHFCKGEAIKVATTGETVKKKTPYNWCAITDHAVYISVSTDMSILNSDHVIQRFLVKDRMAMERSVTCRTTF